MQKISFFLSISLLCCIGFLPAQTVSISSQTDNEVKFQPSSFSDFLPPFAYSSYRYFWNFGDGHFKLKDVGNAGDPVDANQGIVYNYDSLGTFEARLSLTQIYSPPSPPDDDVEEASAPPVNIGSLSAPPTGNDVNMYGSSVVIQPVREIRPGFPMTFIVTYDLNACRTTTGMLEWEFIFQYNSFILDAPGGSPANIVEGYHSESIDLSGSGFGGGTDKLVVKILRTSPPDPAGDERYSFFLNFEVSPDAEPGLPLEGFGTFGEFDANGMIPPCDEFFLPDAYVAKSYDPNYKLVSVDTLTTNPAQLLHYVVHFQNTGGGPTDSIRIVDKLDPRLDPSTLALTDARIAFQHIPTDSLTKYPVPNGLPSLPYPWLDSVPNPVFTLTQSQPTADTFVWQFYSSVLRGTKEPGYGDDFTELETTGSIEFDIYTYPFEEYGVIVENTACIFFDANIAVVTDPAQTFKFCCDEVADSVKGASFDLNKYFSPNLFPNLQSTYSLTSDTAAPAAQPTTQLNTTNYRFDYTPANDGFSGLDVLSIVVCDNNTPPRCDTVNIYICVNVDQKKANVPCDRTSVGMAEDLSMSGIKVFPNPTRDLLWVDDTEATEKVNRLCLYDMRGKKLRDIIVRGRGATPVELSTLPAGLYLLQVNGRGYQKVVKE